MQKKAAAKNGNKLYDTLTANYRIGMERKTVKMKIKSEKNSSATCSFELS